MAGKKRGGNVARRPVSAPQVSKSSNFDPLTSLPGQTELNRGKELAQHEYKRSPEGFVEFALKQIRDSEKPVDAVQCLAMQQEPHLLEFLMTASEEIRETVHQVTCVDSFPDTRAGWPGSLSCTLLDRFLCYLNQLPPNISESCIADAPKLVPGVVGALEALNQSLPRINTRSKEDSFTKKRGRGGRKNTGTLASRANAFTVDPKIFAIIGLNTPTTLSIREAEVSLLGWLRNLLKARKLFITSRCSTAHSKARPFKTPFRRVQQNSDPSCAPWPSSGETSSAGTAPDVSAYSHIRPLGASKYFESSSELGAWPVVISGRAVTHLRQLQRADSHVFTMVQKKITELSQGFFSESNQKRLLGFDTEVPIYEAKVSRDLRIVYQIDLDTDVDAKVDKQIIKLYGVYTHAQFDGRLWSLVSHYHINRRGREYRRRCLYRVNPRVPGQNVTPPAQFPHEDYQTPSEVSSKQAEIENVTDKDFLDLHSLIALEKFIPMSQTLIDSILNDADATHVFHISPKEKEIIYHQSACLVLGRSGTGKTTSIVFKIIGIEKLFEQMDEVTKPRQVFVTQSRVLALRVQEYYHNLVSSSRPTTDHTNLQEEEQVLVDLDDEDSNVFGLPPKYSMLEDKHFPLFLTYDQLCSLLEADLELQLGSSSQSKAHLAAERRFRIQEVIDERIDLDQEDDPEDSEDASSKHFGMDEKKEPSELATQAAVTFEVFVAVYWARFGYHLTKGLDPALVYSEFLGVIEGSEAALQSKTGAISRKEYANLGHRKSSFVSQKDRVYDLYEIYRKRKRELGGYDAAERTHALINAMNGKIPGIKLDCLYIDEVQDNLLIDMKLLHNLSNNPHGIFLAGDTAQTISAGSSFRFEDLSAFLWRLEEQEDAVRYGKRDPIHPTLFHLAVNYRSHGGIVDCASSVVQLISDLFPYSIDKLNKETGLIDGPRPIFFSGWDQGVVRFEQFLRGETNTKVDFGASQAILVRNDTAREELRAQVGEIGLILTLYESKGLEFDDVLLYNFFEDSTPTASTWRVVLHGLTGVDAGPIPRFDEIRHAVICTELKNLYVGLTRARNHCWIWDVSEKAESMKIFWSKQGLVSLCGPKDPMPQLSVSSSEADWAKSGRLLFNKRLYPQAIFCFEKADLPLERDIACAYQSRKEARLLQAKASDRQTLRDSFFKAGMDFLGCATRSKGKQQKSCHRRAAECFLVADDWKRAAETFLAVEEYALAAKNFIRAGCVIQAVDVVQKHEAKLQKKVIDEVFGIARLDLLRKSQYEMAKKLFKHIGDMYAYMENHGLDTTSIRAMERRKRYADSAEEALNKRDILEYIRLCLMSGDNELIRRAASYSIKGLWMTMPFGSTSFQRNESTVTSLLDYLSRMDSRTLNNNQRRQLELFQVIRTMQPDRIFALANLAVNSSSTEALLCLAHCSQQLIPPQNANLSRFVHDSEFALWYYNSLAARVDQLQAASVADQLLLGFQRAQSSVNLGESEYWVFSSSLMFSKIEIIIQNSNPVPFALGLSAVLLPESDVIRLAKEAMVEKIRSEVYSMHTIAIKAQCIQICLDYAVFGNCQVAYCHRHKLSSFKLSDKTRQAHFNQRLRAQILYLLIAYSYDARTSPKHQTYQWAWVRRVYETLIPHFAPLGNILCVEPNRIQELNRGFDVLLKLCERNLRKMSSNPIPTALSDFLVSLELVYRIRGQNISSYGLGSNASLVEKAHSDLVMEASGSLGQKCSIAQHFIDFYIGRSKDALGRVVFATRHIIFQGLSIEANVLVHLLESIGRNIIIHARRWRSGLLEVFNGLLLPRSWVLDTVTHLPENFQYGWSLDAFFETLYKIIERLRLHGSAPADDPLSSLYCFHGSLNPLLKSVFIARICRLLILIGINLEFTISVKKNILKAIVRSLTGPGDVDRALCAKYAQASSWSELETALGLSPLNRSADQLVYTYHRGSSSPDLGSWVEQVPYNAVRPDLVDALSLTSGLSRLSEHATRPEYKLFNEVTRKMEPVEGRPRDLPKESDNTPYILNPHSSLRITVTPSLAARSRR
ncbi:UvrD-like helicase carboxy-terminal domain protein [Ceratobasidium sp. AG-Ba]|nr:UvrD-like helicase carboxy-terminal domain protein [Ceratobasidium sp. AG-Ba]